MRKTNQEKGYCMRQYSHTFLENPGLRVYDIIAPAKAVSADVSQGSDVNNHQDPSGLPHVRTA